MDNQNLADDGRLVVPYDKDRKTITFYDTFVDINGDVIKYDDIAVIQSGALNSSSMIYFYFSKSFNYNFDFTTAQNTDSGAAAIPLTGSARISASRTNSTSCLPRSTASWFEKSASASSTGSSTARPRTYAAS